jgi:hypothetical protein
VLRCELNANMPDFIGNYYRIQRRMTLPQPSRKGKEKQMVKEVKLDEKSTVGYQSKCRFQNCSEKTFKTANFESLPRAQKLVFSHESFTKALSLS